MRRPPQRRAELESIFRQALAAVDAEACVRSAVASRGDQLLLADRPLPRGAGLVLLAVGKAAAPMARAFERRAGSRLERGLVVTPDGHGCALERSVLREAAHPVPDARSELAAREVRELVAAVDPGQVLCVLLSGGASSLLACPAAGLSAADLATTTRLLLAGGADIVQQNAVRKHLSALAGGRLAQHARAERIEVLAISDVPGDRIDVIGSGPFAPDPTTFADACAVLEQLGLGPRVPEAVREHLEAGRRGEREETPKPGAEGLARVHTTVLASNRGAVEAAADAARGCGLSVRVIAQPLAGEAREAAGRLVSLAHSLRPAAPTCLIAGGETTVTLRGSGRGGRNQELALAAALRLDSGPGTALLAAGTDGTDGPTDAAGAYADEATLARGEKLGVDAAAALARNDSYGFFSVEGGLFVTGPTGTNVMDLALLRVDPVSSSG